VEDYMAESGPAGPVGGFLATFLAGLEEQQSTADREELARIREGVMAAMQEQVAQIDTNVQQALEFYQQGGVGGGLQLQQLQSYLWEMEQQKRQVEARGKEELQGLEPAQLKFHGHEIVMLVGDREASTEFARGWVEKVDQNLSVRFAEAPKVAQLGILAPDAAAFPPRREQLTAYGGAEIKALFELYGTEKVVDNKVFPPFLECHFATFRQEFRTFKQWASTSFARFSLEDTWSSIAGNLTFRDQVPNLLRVAQVAMVMFVSTACCERGFSRQNLIKSKLRAKMEIGLLDNLMRIGLVGPKRREFDFGPAIAIWKGGVKKRRRMFVNVDYLV
jgi:hypothetical protein